MKAWKKVAVPHEDVLTGSLKMSEFAADLNLVARGKASGEYQDARQFFERTYITEGMKDLLVSVAKRLKGLGGDPVVQLKTNFGGGKTHSMLAVYHMTKRGSVPASALKGIPQILDAAGIDDIPDAKTAVLVGTAISPDAPEEIGGKKVNTLWGRLAWQLLGLDGYEMVERSDINGTPPGSDLLADILRRAAPCVVFFDEMVKFMGPLVNPRTTPVAGNFAANMTFMQNITEAMKAVPNALLLASLPQSEEELGGVDGEKALLELENIFGRVESIWRPVGTEESFEIVRRRLFKTVGDENEREETCRAFAEMYRGAQDLFPAEIHEAGYIDRMRKTYPIHPELFDRLFADWATLQKFQKTRGVLQYMAIVIKRLYQLDSGDFMIMPGSLPLSDGDVEQKSVQYLQRTGWPSVIQSEIDGATSIAGRLDTERPNFGCEKYAERTARTIFVGSAPGAEAIQQTATRGLDQKRILLGSAMPGHQLGVYEDVLDVLRDKSRYLNNERTRFYYDTRPNLRRTMEERRAHIDQSKAEDCVRAAVVRVCGQGTLFSGVHVFTPHQDIDDNISRGPKLVVMRPDFATAYSRSNEERFKEAANAYLANRGTQPRIHQNRIIFLFPDQNSVNRLMESAKTFLAWKDIVESVERGNLNLDVAQLENAKTSVRRAENAVEQSARETYRFAVIPQSRDKRTVDFGVERVNSQNGAIASSVEEYLRENDLLIKSWSAIFLKKILEAYYFKGETVAVSVRKVWEDTCSYLYLPRLLNEDVFIAALVAGVQDASFGFARGKDGDGYTGFAYGESILVTQIDGEMLVISKSEAEKLHAKRCCPTCHKYPCNCQPNPPPGPQPVPPQPDTPTQPPAPADERRSFYGAINLDASNATIKFADIMREVVATLNAKPGVNVSIHVDIKAESRDPFDANSEVRPVLENCRTLGFTTSVFDS